MRFAKLGCSESKMNDLSQILERVRPGHGLSFPSNFLFQVSLDRIDEMGVGNAQDSEAGIHG